ncbi:hypothetical protein [Streptomyces phaeoluteigriseus]
MLKRRVAFLVARPWAQAASWARTRDALLSAVFVTAAKAHDTTGKLTTEPLPNAVGDRANVRAAER